jgi:hypothetical protein
MARFALTLLAVVVVACGEPTPSAGALPAQSPTPERIGTATLSETACDFAMPDSLPLRIVEFSVINNTGHTGRFILVYIENGHTYKDLIDYWNGPMGQVERPNFITEIALVDVPTKSAGEMVTSIVQQGSYAFNCGYMNDAGKVTGFWHGPLDARVS